MFGREQRGNVAGEGQCSGLWGQFKIASSDFGCVMWWGILAWIRQREGPET